jgi:hypothetical protein
MTALVAAHDWARTPVGPVTAWSPALRTTVENLLGNGFGLLLWWGPQFCGRELYLIRTLAEDVRVEPSRGYGTQLDVVLPLSRATV